MPDYVVSIRDENIYKDIKHRENREEDADRRERAREKVGGGNAGLLPVGLLWDSINRNIS